jgi:hypothetical protein
MGLFETLGGLATSTTPAGIGAGLAAGAAGGLISSLGSLMGDGGTTPGMHSQMRSSLPGELRAPMSPQQKAIFEQLAQLFSGRLDQAQSGTDPLSQFAGSVDLNQGAISDLKSKALALRDQYAVKAGG